MTFIGDIDLCICKKTQQKLTAEEIHSLKKS